MVYIIGGAVVTSVVLLVLLRYKLKMAALLTWLVGSINSKMLLGRTEKSVEEGSPDKQSSKTKEKNKSKRGKPRQTLKNQHEEPSFSTSLSTPIEEIIEESLTEEASADIIPPTGTKKKHKSRKPHPNKSEDIDWPVDEDEITKKAVKVQKEVEADDVGFSFPPVREKGKRNKDKKIAKKKTDILDPSVPQDFFVFVKDKPPKPGIVNNYQTRKAKQAVIETVPDRARRFSDSFEKVQFQAVGNRIEEKCQPENLVKPEHKESKKVSPQVSYASVLTNSTIECDEEKVSNINSTELIELQLKLSSYSNSTESCSGSNFSSIELLNKITPSACESPEEIESQFEVIKANDLVSSDPNCIFITEEASTEVLKDSPVCANDEEAVKKTEKVPVSDSLESESNEIEDLPELDISSEELRDLTAAEGDLEPETHPVDFDLLQHRESDKTNLDKEVSVPNGTEKFLEVEVTSGNEPSTANNHQGNSDLLEELDRIDLDEVAHISKNKEQVLEINPTSGEEAKFISSGEVDSSSDNNFFDFDQSASNTNSDLAEFAQAIEESLGVQKKGSILHNTANSSKQESLLEFIELEKQLSEFDKEIVFVSEPTTKTQQNQDLSQSIPSTVESDQNSSVGSCQFKSPLEHSSFSEKSADHFVFPDYSNSGTFSGPEFTPPELFKDILPDILTNSLVTKDQAEDLDKLNESAALSEIRRNTPLELIKDFQQSPTSYHIADLPVAVSQTSGISSEEFQPNPADTSSFGSDRIEGEILCADSRPQSGAFSSEDSETNIRVITSRFIEEERFVRKYSYWTGSCEQLELLATPIRENKKLTSETMQQVRVLTLNDLEHQESTLYRIKKEWIIEFRVGPSLFGRKVFLYCNYPFEKAGKTAEFNRNKYQLLEWAWDEGCENADDTAAFIQIKAAVAGSFHYFFTYEKGENFERHGSGYFLVDPVLSYGRNEDLPLDCIQCQTVLTKGLGSFSKWESKLRVAKESGYNMIHFTPIQELGESNSSYSLSEQLQLNPIFKKDDGEMPTFEDVEKLVSKLREEWKITSICDIVLNHTANESKWIQAHPEVTYNCVDCPYMRPAYLLDAALHQFSMDVKKGLYEDRGVPSEVDSEEHLNAIRHHLQQSVLEPLNIPELYMIDVNKCVAEFLMLARTVTPAAQNRGEVTEELELVQDPEYRRLAASVLECFLIGAILFDIYMLVVPNGQDHIFFTVMILYITTNTSLLVLCKKEMKCTIPWAAIPYMCWYVAITQVLSALILKKNEVTSRDSLGWVLLLVYLVYVTLPIRLRYCIILSIGTCASYFAAIIIFSKSDLHFYQQHVSNSILLLTASLLGITSFLVEDKQQRRAFLETRQSLEVKLVIEEQSAEQERLLLSVLPEHVAVQMRQDLDSTDSQFKKIYMSRHENVSILYADIVGFTAISSTYSAQELVKMLNELFARFDKLAEKYQQLRIKILGDCYYCISGAPKERPDHAVLCVHMGLSMVKAIKYVQQTANSPVDMRVGIHTGAVLAGVLGQRQWQFDVYSKDVELANKMESSGLPGRVHISDSTYSFLSGEFEVEPAYGEKRDESLRTAGLKTFFIVRVIKPFQPSVQEVQNGTSILPDEDSCVIAEVTSDKEKQKEQEANQETDMKRSRQDSADFKIRLRKELVSRDGHKELSKNTKIFTLAFIDPQKEKSYHLHTESFSSFTLLMFLIVRLAIGATIVIVLPSDLTINITYCTENIIFFILVMVAIAEEFPGMSKCWRTFKESMLIRRILSTACVVIMGSVNILDTVSCVQFKKHYENCSTTTDIDASCLYPSYFSYFTVLILIASSLPACLSYLWKSFLMLLIAGSQCLVNIVVLGSALDCEELMKHWTSLTQGKYTLSGILLTATLALAFLARHMEKVARVLFLWRCEVEEQRDCAEDMRRRNEALVYNILPPHVATHFMGNRKRQHDELYSQSYAEVGVLFASMPNFSDFYSEETVNNQGLECLRFLNEVISDFDALLELPKFQDVIKIKTIGSTYMAASGLNPTRQMKPEDPISVRWAHLAILVDFALELKKALQSINEQSFNHFVLKLGINHGPITAGVIGARKPHYDIWGNTVNVASRMESTGKAGCIQVTEETCEILQHFGYEFEQRGLVSVKGKGQLMTYYLQGKAGKTTPATVGGSPKVSASTMDTVNEEDESHDSPTSKSDEKTVIECSEHTDDGVLPPESEMACEETLVKKEVEPKDSTEATLLLSQVDT